MLAVTASIVASIMVLYARDLAAATRGRRGRARPTPSDRSPKGRARPRAAGAALKALGVQIDACLTSPKVRAADTARAGLRAARCRAAGWSRGSPAGASTPDGAGGRDSATTVLLVGHEPDFSNAVRELTGAQREHEEGRPGGDRRAASCIVLLRPRRAEADRRLAPSASCLPSTSSSSTPSRRPPRAIRSGSASRSEIASSTRMPAGSRRTRSRVELEARAPPRRSA